MKLCTKTSYRNYTVFLRSIPGILFISLMFSLFFPFSAAALPQDPLTKPPLGEQWLGIYFNDERTGFAHLTITKAPEGYLIAGDSSVKMSGLGFSRKASVRERYLVNPDLTLRSFEVSQTIDDSPMKLTGHVDKNGVTVTMKSGENSSEKILPTDGPVYPPPALNLYPLFRNVADDDTFSVSTLDPESVDVKDVEITVVGSEKIDGRKVLHLRNDLYQFVENDIWVDAAGKTLRESVRDGWIETRMENKADIHAFIAEAAVGKRDMILDFSLVSVDRPIERLPDLTSMTVEISGFAENLPLLTDSVQNAERLQGGTVLFTIDNRKISVPESLPVEDLPAMKPYLETSDRIPADNPEIIQKKTEILCGINNQRTAVEKLVKWVADNVDDTGADTVSPLETLEKRTGNCQSQTRLYASLARAAGIPTRFVSGIIYVEGRGFLFHSWAESYLDAWLPVDPTFGEIPANATHIKLVEGDSPGDLAPLAAIIGLISARVVETKYREKKAED